MSDSTAPPSEGAEQAASACCAAIAELQRRAQQGVAQRVQTDTGEPLASLSTEPVHDD